MAQHVCVKTNVIPTLRKRPANERGQSDHGWLQARFTFSFARYVDPDHMGFKALRVMNNETIQPRGGFPIHPHSDMEIFTYVIDGQLAHKDSMGNGAVIEAGNLQYMSAGSGVTHSEFNPSQAHQTHLYQVWLHPRERGGEPRYAEIPMGDAAPPNTLSLLFSGSGRDGSTEIRQCAEIFFGRIDARRALDVPASESMPHVWLQVISGGIDVLGEILNAGDGLAIENQADGFRIQGLSNESRLLAFRLNEPTSSQSS